MNFYFTGRVDPSTRGCQKNGPSAPGPGVELAEPSSVHRLFEAQAARAPDGIALVFKNRHVSYGELNRRSAALGRVLGACLAQSNGLVGICAERSPELAVALLAVLRAGAAYVPLDPSGPDERLRAMLDDARPDMVLTQRHLLSRVSGYSFGGLVILELARLIIEAGEKIGLLVLVDPSPPPELKAATRSGTVLGAEAAAPPSTRRGGAMRKLVAMWRNVPRRVRWSQRMAKVLLCETCVALGRPVPPSLRLSHFAAGSDRALARYKAKTYPGSFVLFRRPDNLTEAHWRGLASGEVVMHETWMDHNELLEQPYVQTICREIIHHMGLAQAAAAPRAGSHPRSQQVVAGSDGEPRFAE